MDENERTTGGWLNSLRRTIETLLGLAQNRFELFAVELQEEKLRAINVIVWLVVALALIVAGVLVGLGALALYLWHVAAYYGLIGLALVSLGAGAGVLWVIRNRIRNGSTPFAKTVDEFKKDRTCLGTET
jgi:uncharacterized membrane protein YqjE